MAHKIQFIDVFTNQFSNGNPVAVIFDADDLDTKQMQNIASWTNLSETTFICSPKNPNADYELRIFTPKSELPFAGHPTIGSCFAAINNKVAIPKNGKIIQECKVGLVEINTNNRIEFALPNAKFQDLEIPQITQLENILGEKIIGIPKIVNVGPKWITAQLSSDEVVLKTKVDYAQMAKFEKSLDATGVTIFGKTNKAENLIEIRSFAPSDNVLEDPVCGSGNGAVCAYLFASGQIEDNSNYISRQGRAIGRDGTIYARIENQQIYIGGDCVLGISGIIEI
jgi:PhzF family phenazine biosynthesis protein